MLIFNNWPITRRDKTPAWRSGDHIESCQWCRSTIFSRNSEEIFSFLY